MSTVRELASPEMPHTSSSSWPRVKTRPGCSRRTCDQLELERPELELGAVDEDAVANRVELEASPAELAVAPGRGPRRAALRGPPGEGAHAHDELADAERLDDVVVGADLEAEDAVVLVAARREHQHGDVREDRVGAQRAAHLHAGHVRQHRDRAR